MPFYANGPFVEKARKAIKEQSLSLGWRLDDAMLEDVHLVVDGVRFDADVAGLSVRIVVPASARAIWLNFDAGVPASLSPAPAGDDRKLGLAIASLTIDDGLGAKREIRINNPTLDEGLPFP